MLVVVLVAACGAPHGSAPAPRPTRAGPTSRPTSAARTFHPQPPTAVPPLPAGAPAPRGEIERACPYLPPVAADGTGGVADLEGNRVGRTTVVTHLRPIGCRFYFRYGDGAAIAAIEPSTFATARDAHDAMILTARTGTDASGLPGLLPGVDAVTFRTTLDGVSAREWACAFAAGRVLVVVRTESEKHSASAVAIAEAIAPRFLTG